MIGRLFHQQMMKYAMAYFATPGLPLHLESPPDRREPSAGGDEPPGRQPGREEEIEEASPGDESLDEEDNDLLEEEELEEEDWALTEDEEVEEVDWPGEEAFKAEALPGESGTDNIP